MARATKYSDKIAERFCEKIAAGSTLTSAAHEINVSASTVYNWINSNEQFAKLYKQSRIAQAAQAFDELSELEEKVLDKQIDASAFRVMLDSRKWRISNVNNLYGGENTGNSVDIAEELRKRTEKLNVKTGK